MLYPPFAARAKVRDRFSAEASPHGLDGMAYMDNAAEFENGVDVRLADDKAAMQWLLQQCPGVAGDPGGPDPGIPLGQPFQRLHRPADRAGLELASTPAALGRAQRRGRAPRQ